MAQATLCVPSTISVVPSSIRLRVLDRVLRGGLDLPVLPPVAQEILGLGTSDADAHRLAALVQRDPALAANVLRVANSPMYAARVHIVSLQQAVSRLGLVALREMAFGASVRSRAFVASGFEGATRDLWAHALAAGAFAREIAKVRKKNAESMFLCGLLHDIGIPVILHSLAKAAGPIRVSAEDALAFAEEHHTSVGGKIARTWKLPETVALAAEHHHGTEAPEQHAEIGAATALADELAHATFDEDETPVHDPRLASILNLYPDEIAALLARRDAIRSFVETQP